MCREAAAPDRAMCKPSDVNMLLPVRESPSADQIELSGANGAGAADLLVVEAQRVVGVAARRRRGGQQPLASAVIGKGRQGGHPHRRVRTQHQVILRSRAAEIGHGVLR